ncbi:MAG: hypothetical protein JWO67_4242 [Streptosporangiaceae bacterium]|nr:hypothetical protein [Streptosporangiaceae bacterium]
MGRENCSHLSSRRSLPPHMFPTQTQQVSRSFSVLVTRHVAQWAAGEPARRHAWSVHQYLLLRWPVLAHGHRVGRRHLGPWPQLARLDHSPLVAVRAFPPAAPGWVSVLPHELVATARTGSGVGQPVAHGGRAHRGHRGHRGHRQWSVLPATVKGFHSL